MSEASPAKAYALHLLSGWGVPLERALQLWEIRAARQEAFWSSPTPISLDVVLRETAILTQVGGPQVRPNFHKTTLDIVERIAAVQAGR